MTKLSIITINRNNAVGLEKTIRSVLHQTFTDFEYIVIDGASNDGSSDVIKQYSEKFNYWISEPDSGIFNAMNKGILQAKGEYCLFLNSGDWFYHKDVLKECFEIGFTEDFVYGHQLKEVNGELVDDPCLDVAYITFKTIKASHIPHQCTFIRSALFVSLGHYNEANKIISDWEFLMKGLFIYNCSIRRINVKMTVYDTQGASSIEDYKQLQKNERRVFLEKQFPLIIKDYDDFENFMKKSYIKLMLNLRKFKNNIYKPGS